MKSGSHSISQKVLSSPVSGQRHSSSVGSTHIETYSKKSHASGHSKSLYFREDYFLLGEGFIAEQLHSFMVIGETVDGKE